MAGYWVCFLSGLFLVTDISTTVAPIGVKFCTMVHMCPGCVFSPFGGGAPGDPQIRNLPTSVWRVLCFANALVTFYSSYCHCCVCLFGCPSVALSWHHFWPLLASSKYQRNSYWEMLSEDNKTDGCVLKNLRFSTQIPLCRRQFHWYRCEPSYTINLNISFLLFETMRVFCERCVSRF